jgi:hypothetical protein
LLNELCKSIHADNVQAGWWTSTKDVPAINFGDNLVGIRNIPEMLCLMHSEVTEAWQGCKLNAVDDKLPHRLMLEVELADALIRMFDLLGSMNVDFEHVVSVVNQEFKIESTLAYPGDIMCDLHDYIDRAMEGHRKNKVREDGIRVLDAELANFYICVMIIAEYNGLDIMAAIDEKRKFNASRPDHKIENRLKEGGKQF